MRGVRAFTIVEFTIAIAVASILSAAAIARYNTYLREQEFIAGGEQIANCISRASSQVRDGGTTTGTRFSRATITYSNVEPYVGCSIETFSQFRTDGSAHTTSQLLLGNPVEAGTSQVFRAEYTDLNGASNIIRLVFGSFENGAPLGMSANAIITRQPDDSTNLATYVKLGKGFSLSETANTIRLDSAVADMCGVITSTPLMTPVQFKLQSSCL